MRKHGVFEVVDVKECFDNGCNPLTLMWVDKMKGDVCCSRLVCRGTKKAENKDEQLGEDVFSPMPLSEGLKMLVCTMMTGNHADGPIEMSTWNVSRAPSYSEARRRIYRYLPEGTNRRANWPGSAGSCADRETQRQSGWAHGQKC